jgi:hypothetical protein
MTGSEQPRKRRNNKRDNEYHVDDKEYDELTVHPRIVGDAGESNQFLRKLFCAFVEIDHQLPQILMPDRAR